MVCAALGGHSCVMAAAFVVAMLMMMVDCG